jgi:hypothetical protein
MVNLYYDLPLDVREIIDKKKKEMELRDALLAELKAFDRVAWSEKCMLKNVYPYNTDWGMVDKLKLFYKYGEKQQVGKFYYKSTNRVTKKYGEINFDEFFFHEEMFNMRKRLGYILT